MDYKILANIACIESLDRKCGCWLLLLPSIALKKLNRFSKCSITVVSMDCGAWGCGFKPQVCQGFSSLLSCVICRLKMSFLVQCFFIEWTQHNDIEAKVCHQL